jgi:tetratricopeptide (TPR) repeat protein
MEQFRGLLAEQLSDADRDQIEAHVEGCDACQRTLKDLLTDSVDFRSLGDFGRLDSLPGSAESNSRHEPGSGFLRRLKLASPAPVPGVDLDNGEFETQLPSPLGDFRLLREIGRGGMGVVYEAEQMSLGRRVALKVLPFASTLDARTLQRFRNEAQAAAHLHHPNIVPVHATGCERGVHFYAMQYIKGQTLAALIAELRQRAGTGSVPQRSTRLQMPGALEPVGSGDLRLTGPYSPAIVQTLFGETTIDPAKPSSAVRSFKSWQFFQTVAHLGIQAAEALEHAHELGIIHRDIKPGNLLIEHTPAPPGCDTVTRCGTVSDRATTGAGEELRLWITDFGLAHMASVGGQAGCNLTLTGDLVGTLRYMSPEQALAKRVIIDHRTDIYSLGVTLYELLTLTPAFTGQDRQELLRQIAFEEPRPPRRINKAIPAELETMVLKAIEKNPADRYATAQDLAHDLHRFLEDKPILARRPSMVQRARKWTRRHRAATWALVCVAAVWLLAAGSLLYERHRRLAAVAQQVRESLATARTLLAENQPAQARQQLADAQARLTAERNSLRRLAEEVDALAAELDRFDEFFRLIDRAHDAEIPVRTALASLADSSHGHKSSGLGRAYGGRDGRSDSCKAVPLFLEALSRYRVLERDDWRAALEDSELGPDQVTRVRRAVYEVLLWLADDTSIRQQDHGREGNKLSPPLAARQALTYLAKAEQAWTPTKAFYRLRARGRDEFRRRAEMFYTGSALEDARRAWQMPATMAVDHYLLGQLAYLSRQRAEGIKQFEAALRLEPNHYWSLLWLGDCLCDLGQGPEDFAAAVGIYTGCVAQRPRHFHAYQCRGNTYGKLGRSDEAIADYCRVMELDPYYAAAWNNRGAECTKLGQYSKALEDFTRAIELDPQLGPAWNNRGSAYSNLGQYQKALDDISRAIKLDPSFQAAWKNRGLTYSSMGHHQKAFDAHSRAIALNPNDAEAWTNRGLALIPGDQPTRQYEKAIGDLNRAIALDRTYARAWSARGLAYHKLRQYDNAVADHTQAIALDPKHAGAWTSRGLACHELGQYQKAVDDHSKSIELDPKDKHHWHARGDAYFKLQQYDKALGDYAKSIALDRKFLEGWIGLGNVYASTRRFDKALAAAKHAIDIQPDSAVAYFNLGVALAMQKKTAEAGKAFRKAIALKKDYPEAHLNLGSRLMEQAKLADAEQAFREAIRLRHNYPAAHHNLGAALQAQGKLPESAAAHRQAILLRPDFAEAHDGLSHVLWAQGKLADAVQAEREAVRHQPKNPSFHYNLGSALATHGEHAEAEKEFLEAIHLRPGYAEAHCNLGNVLKLQGRFADALAAYKRGHKLGAKHPGWRYPSAQWIREAEQLLALDAKLTAVDKGKDKPANAGEAVLLACFCQVWKKRFAASARFYAMAFDAEPKLTDELIKEGARYDAACAAALAGCGQGADADKLDDKQRAHWRRQALEWLRADLAFYQKLVSSGPAKDHTFVQKQLQHWLSNASLAHVRGDALARLPEAEREAWQQLWSGVEQTLKKTNYKDTKDSEKSKS